MLAGQPGKRAVMRVDGDFFTTPKEDMTAYLESVRIYLEKFGLSLTGYYGGAFVEFQASSFGRAGQEEYLKSAFQVRDEDGQAPVSEEALWFISWRAPQQRTAEPFPVHLRPGRKSCWKIRRGAS
jgi:hypothetical protein